MINTASHEPNITIIPMRRHLVKNHPMGCPVQINMSILATSETGGTW